MMDLRNEILPVLENHRLNGLDLGPGTIYPYYSGYSLCNLPSSVCYWLGAPGLGSGPLSREILDQFNADFQHVILVLVDGLGLGQFEQVLEEEKKSGQSQGWNSFINDAVFAPLTSIVPSTTAAALTTLWTGVPPSAHGITGYEMWLKEYSMIINAITHTAVSFSGDPGGLRRGGFVPETFLPVPTLGGHLTQNGILPFAYHHQTIFRSSLSNMLLPGVKGIPYRTLSDLWISLLNELSANASARTYSYVYWGDLDELAHRYGPQDQRIKLELNTFSRLFAQFLEMLRSQKHGNTLVLLTADHGQVYTPRYNPYELRFHPDLVSCLTMLPSGENRLPYLYLRPEREDRVKDYVDQTWRGKFRLFPANQLLEAGLFGDGNIYPRILDRIGDQIAVPQEYSYWWWADRENTMLGRHGGLSRAEMLVPLLAMAM
jgi:hypothetical protein